MINPATPFQTAFSPQGNGPKLGLVEAALLALIFYVLRPLLERLDALFARFRAGTLPTPQPRPTAPAPTRQPVAAPTARPVRAQYPRAPRPARTPRHAAARAPRRASPALRRPRPTHVRPARNHAPRPVFQKSSRQTTPTNHALNVPYT